MEERKYTFYDRYQKVKYANITAEELEVLNISYNKEHYMFDQQHQRNNTVLFCGLESENSCATDFIADDGRDIASDITTEIFFKELFSDLTEKEKKIVSDYIPTQMETQNSIMKKRTGEVRLPSDHKMKK